MAEDTVLTLTALDGDPFGVSNYASRGLKQTLEPIQAASVVRRTVNGDLVNLSATQLRKLKSTISGSDQAPPVLNGIWPGMTVTVGCVVELGYLTAGGSPAYSVVSGSSRVDGDITRYRPEIDMMVIGWSQDQDEYGSIIGWQMALEEV